MAVDWMSKDGNLMREIEETDVFCHRGLKFRELSPLGVQVYHPGIGRWFNTDFMYKWNVLQDVFPDVGLWSDYKSYPGSRDHLGSLRYPEEPWEELGA